MTKITEKSRMRGEVEIPGLFTGRAWSRPLQYRKEVNRFEQELRSIVRAGLKYSAACMPIHSYVHAYGSRCAGFLLFFLLREWMNQRLEYKSD